MRLLLNMKPETKQGFKEVLTVLFIFCLAMAFGMLLYELSFIPFPAGTLGYGIGG